MCGIIGYLGYRNAAPLLIEGLKKLEYRGYDSFGIATLSDDLHVYKVKGKISQHGTSALSVPGTIGIGHTRWATHGEPSDINAHPHLDCHDQIAIAHNGIIENYSSLKRDLLKRGHIFRSETDTEVIAHLTEEHYQGDLLQAIKETIPLLEGSYAILAITSKEPSIIAARNRSPLVLGIGDHELLAASDVTPLLDFTSQIEYLEDGDIASISSKGVHIYHDGNPIERPIEQATWKSEDTKKGAFEHFMLKEIFEQPRVFYETYRSSRDPEFAEIVKKSPILNLVACGTSYHAALIAKYIIEESCRIPVRVELASEFKYYTPPLSGPVIGISQSGETADTLTALQKGKFHNCPIYAITNVQGSTITRMVDKYLLTRAGPEISVAATKSFIAQLAVFLQLANIIANHSLDPILTGAHRAIEAALRTDLTEAVKLCTTVNHIFYIGRGPFYPVAMEGALKMKEIAYIHAEAYAAGELKHGPFALLSPQTPVIAICPPGATHAVMLSNIKEIKARKAPLIALGEPKDLELIDISDLFIPLTGNELWIHILVTSVILQLLAYQTAKELGCEIDQPKNLAKSVTVE